MQKHPMTLEGSEALKEELQRLSKQQSLHGNNVFARNTAKKENRATRAINCSDGYRNLLNLSPGAFFKLKFNIFILLP